MGDLVHILARAVHDRCFGIASMADPEVALREISDGGGIHEAVHQLLRALPPFGTATAPGEATTAKDAAAPSFASNPQEDGAAKSASEM